MNLLLPVFLLPLVAFLAALAIPRRLPQNSRWWALFSSLAVFVLSLFLVAGFDHGLGQEQFAIDIPWMTTPDIHFAISVNGVSLWLVLLSTFHPGLEDGQEIGAK